MDEGASNAKKARRSYELELDVPGLASEKEFLQRLHDFERVVDDPKVFNFPKRPELYEELVDMVAPRKFCASQERRWATFCISLLSTLTKVPPSEETKGLIERFFEHLMSGLVCRYITSTLSHETVISKSIVGKKDEPMYVDVIRQKFLLRRIRALGWKNLSPKTVMLASTLGRCLVETAKDSQFMEEAFVFLRDLCNFQRFSCYIATGICTTAFDMLNHRPDCIGIICTTGLLKPLINHVKLHQKHGYTTCVDCFFDVIDSIAVIESPHSDALLDNRIFDLFNEILLSEELECLYPALLATVWECFDAGPKVMDRLVQHTLLLTLVLRSAHEAEDISMRSRNCIHMFISRANGLQMLTAIEKGLMSSLCRLLRSRRQEMQCFGLQTIQRILRRIYSEHAKISFEMISKTPLRSILPHFLQHENPFISKWAQRCVPFVPNLGNTLTDYEFGSVAPASEDEIEDNEIFSWIDVGVNSDYFDEP